MYWSSGKFSARFERDWKLSSTAALFFCLTLAQLLRFPGRRLYADFGCVLAVSDCSSFLFWPNMIMMRSPFSLAVVVKQNQLWASREFLKANVAWLRFGTIIGYAEREFGQAIWAAIDSGTYMLKFSFGICTDSIPFDVLSHNVRARVQFVVAAIKNIALILRGTERNTFLAANFCRSVLNFMYHYAEIKFKGHHPMAWWFLY